MSVKWLHDNKIYSHGTGYGIGTVRRVRDYSLNEYWESSTVNTLYFDFGTGVNIKAFAIITGDGQSGTAFIGYGHDGTLYEGTHLVDVICGTSKSFFDYGTHRYWKVGLFDPQDLTEYDDSTIEYDDSAMTYDSVVFDTDRVDELFLGRQTVFGQDPIYPFGRSVTYAHTSLEAGDGKRFGYHDSRKRSWHFNYANVRTSTKDDIVSMLGTTDGGAKPFWLSISDDENEIYIGRFDQESFSFEELAKNAWNVGFEVREET